jgi:hypothetical protein
MVVDHLHSNGFPQLHTDSPHFGLPLHNWQFYDGQQFDLHSSGLITEYRTIILTQAQASLHFIEIMRLKLCSKGF